MKKELLSEITRISEMMGVKNNPLILESFACPFCLVIRGEVELLAKLVAKNEDIPLFKFKTNELLERVKNSEDLSINQKASLQNVINKLKEAESASDNVASFKTKVQDAIDNNEGLRDVTSSNANLIKSKIINVIDYSAIAKKPEFAKYLFDSNVEIGDLKKQLQELVNFPVKMEKIVNKYKTIDSYVDAIGGVFESTLKEAGYDEPLLSNLVLLMKKFVKEETGLKFAFPSKMDEPINTKPIDIQNKVEEPNNDINIKVKSVGKELPPSRFHIGGTSIDNINTPGARPIGGSDPIIAKDRRGQIINNPYYSFLIEEIGDDVVYTFNRQDIQDAAGRGGNYSVSINYPKNSGVSLDDVKQILLNKSNEIFNKLKDAKARGYGGADIGEVSTPTNAIPDGESGVFTPTPDIPILKR